jgi:hypothetical protein
MACRRDRSESIGNCLRHAGIEVGRGKTGVSRWETAYMAPLQDNQAMVYDTRVRVKF